MMRTVGQKTVMTKVSTIQREVTDMSLQCEPCGPDLELYQILRRWHELRAAGALGTLQIAPLKMRVKKCQHHS